jgi:DNA repair photolyase
MRRLADAGVPCGVYMAPVLPGLTDDDAAIAAVAEAARDYGATAFWAGPLRLAPLVKEHYAGFLRDTFPALLPRYAQLFPGANAPGAYRKRLDERIATIRRTCGFAGDEPDSIREKLPPHGGHAAAGSQLRLPLG